MQPSIDEAPLSWREIIAGAGLAGPLKVLAAESQVIELTRDDADRRRRAKEHQEMVERFKNDPLVKEVLRLFGGTIDESSIRPLSEEEKRGAE